MLGYTDKQAKIISFVLLPVDPESLQVALKISLSKPVISLRGGAISTLSSCFTCSWLATWNNVFQTQH